MTENKRRERFDQRISEMLEAVAEARPLQQVLSRLVESVEEFQPEIKASVLLLDHKTRALRHAASRRLPAEYCTLIDGTIINPKVGSCGTAAAENRLVIVEDIATDPLWDDYRHLALPFGLRACWSQPITDHNNTVLGTFALYYDHPRRPTNAEIDLIRTVAQLAGIAIRRKMAEDTLVNDMLEIQKAKAELQQVNDTLEKRVAERTAELEKVKNRIEAIFNHSGDGLLLMDITAGIQQVNYTFETMFGIELDSYVGMRITNFVHPSDRPMIENAIQTVAAKHQTIHLEARAQRINGTEFDMEISIAPVNRSEKAVQNLVCIIRDVTERKQAQQAVAEERNLLRTLIDAIPDFIYIKDNQHRMILNNAAQIRSLGASSPEALLGKTDFDLFPPEMAADFHQDEIELFRTGRAMTNIEERTIGADGSAIWALTTKVPLRNLNGDLIGLVGITRDVSEIKANEEALLRSQADLQSVIDSTNTAYILLDENGIIRMANRLAQTYSIQFSKHPFVVGERFVDSIPEMISEDVKARFARVMKGESLHMEATTLSGLQHFEYHYYPVRADNGKIVGMNIAFTDITERKKVEQQLRYLASLQEHMYDAVIGTDLNYRIQSWNKAAERMYGWTAEEAIGKNVVELLNTEIVSGNSPELAQVQLLEEGYWSGEAIQYHRDGTPIDVSASVVINYDANEAPTGVIAVHHDITARKAAEAALEQKRADEREMQMYLRALHEIGIDLVGTESLDDFFRMCVEQGRARFGFERMAVLLYDAEANMVRGTYGTDETGAVSDERTLQFEAPDITTLLRSTLDRDTRFTYEEDAILYTSNKPTGRGSNAAAALWNGEMLGWLVIDNAIHHQPITRAQLDILSLFAMTVSSLLARKRAELALKENEEKFRSFVESAPIATIVTDANGKIVLVNKEAEHLFGYERGEFVGQSVEILMAEENRESHVLHRMTYMAANGLNRPHPIELSARCKDGKQFPADIQLSYIEMHPSPVVMCFIIDITQRIRAEEALRQALKQEREVGELKSSFISMASHEFRTPLATIMATTENLIYHRDKMLNADIDERLERIRYQVSYMTEIMEAVLELARMQAGRIEFKPTIGDLDGLFQKIVSEFESQPVHLGRIVYLCPMRPVLMPFDARLMRQVVSNLISNGLKYSPIEKPVRVILTHDNDFITLRVRDEGIGIPVDDQKHLFQPFHRAVNVGDINGTGLGLSIVKLAVELHGGRITVESKVGVGTIFTVVIPKVTTKNGLPND